MEADASIIDVVHTLDDPVEYVRGVVGSFFAYHFDAEKAVVRIGTSGKGIIPNYCIEQCGDSTSTIFERRHCFHGRNHKEMS